MEKILLAIVSAEKVPLIVLVGMLQITPLARFLCSFSDFWFGGPLGSIKHKKSGANFFDPPNPFFGHPKNRDPENR